MYNCAMHAEPLEVLAGKLLRQRCWQLAVAESCTGGLVGHLLTNVPGSSDYFLGGVISYANEAKLSLLGVHLETLETFGAVSRQTVLEMAGGVRHLLSADVGLSVSGIAGPGGGTPVNPSVLPGSVSALPDMKWPGSIPGMATGFTTKNVLPRLSCSIW